MYIYAPVNKLTHDVLSVHLHQWLVPSQVRGKVSQSYLPSLWVVRVHEFSRLRHPPIVPLHLLPVRSFPQLELLCMTSLVVLPPQFSPLPFQHTRFFGNHPSVRVPRSLGLRSQMLRV
jgi:hypothetical protein